MHVTASRGVLLYFLAGSRSRECGCLSWRRCKIICLTHFAGVAERETRRPQKPLSARTCGFDSRPRYDKGVSDLS